MEEASYSFKIIIDGHLTKIPHGVKAIKWNSAYFVWTWHGNYIDIIEQPFLSFREASNHSNELNVIEPQGSEIRLKGNIVDIFLVEGGSVYALDSLGFIYSFSHIENKPSSPVVSMEVDLFSSSPTNDISFKWKENEVTRVINCEEVISVCQLISGLAVLTVEEERVAIQIYSLPEFNFKSVVHLERHSYQDAVLSSCNISLLAPSLKKHFQDKIEVLDSEIILVGMSSGLVLWCCVASSSVIKGPFFLCSLFHKVHHAYWITNDPESNLTTLLLIVLISGTVVIFGSQTKIENKPTTLYLPECVKTSWICGNCIISSNFVDSFVSEFKFGEKIMICTSLPIKGITAMTKAPDSEDLIVTTMHSVYIMEPHCMSLDRSTQQFVIPEQSLLENLLLQTHLLDDIYKEMHKEDEALKAISTSIVAQNITNLFRVKIKVTTDSEFSVTINLTEAGISFSCELWNLNTDICSMDGHKESMSTRMKEDFNSEHDLQIVCSYELTIGSSVAIELVCFLESGQPVLIVPVEKVEVDACHLMVSKFFAPVTPKNEETLGDILKSWNSEKAKEKEHECRLILKIPEVIPLALSLQMILQDSQERIMVDDWNKISEFKKHNAHVRIQNIPVLFNINLESKELVITSSDIQLCHKVKESVSKRFNQNAESKKCIPEDLALEIQAVYQALEIEILKDVKEFSPFQLIKNKLRTTISSQLDSL